MPSLLPRKTTEIRLDEPSAQLAYDRFDLIVVKGADAGKHQPFGQASVQVGTARANDFVLTDPTVSRFHLRIETRPGGVSVVDVGSTNGTFLGGFRVEVAHLVGESFIAIGNTTLRFFPSGDRTIVSLPNVDRFGSIIGRSSRMRDLYRTIERVAGSDISVIIEGETGTGKDLVARLLHDESVRATGPFEVLDCTAIPDSLAESELFGHVRGAFTGAERDRAGIFERAHTGTVFLDEIGDVKLELQPKLLRVLETGQLRRVGGNQPIGVDVRVIAATHRSLRQLVNSGGFREDLYYRLAGCKIDLPALRERAEDIPLLITHFLEALRRSGKRNVPEALDPETVRQLSIQPWPGNVRQLRHAVARAAIMGHSALTAEDPATPTPAGPGSVDYGLPLRDAKDAFARRYLERLVERHQGDLRAAAQAADVHPKSLARLLRRYGLGRG
jgi:DNA-binding NtrC family response regulator